MFLPKVSVITVVYNDVHLIESTIQSVINQTYENIEYIIIDGNSIDGTKDIISQYENEIDYWVSENDKGIYYAMNKGIDAATGDWINFLNSGDRFYSESTVKNIFDNRRVESKEFIYGNTLKVNNNISKVDVPAKARVFWKNLVVHQSIFSRIELNKKYPFDTTFKVAADFDFIFKLFFFKHESLYLDIVISKFNLIGYSHFNRYKGFSEDRKIALKYKGDNMVRYNVYLHYVKVTLVGKVIDFLKLYMPFFYRFLKAIKD